MRSSDSPAKKSYTSLHADKQKINNTSRNSSKQSTSRIKARTEMRPRASPPVPSDKPKKPAEDVPEPKSSHSRVLKFEKSLTIPDLSMDELQRTTESRFSASIRSEGEIELRYHKAVVENAQLKEKLAEFQEQNLENVRVAETELRKLFLKLKESKAAQEKLLEINKEQQKQLEIAVDKIQELENTVFMLKSRKNEVSAMNHSIDQSLGYIVDRFRTFSLLKKVFKLFVEACNKHKKITTFERKMKFKKKIETLKISFAAWKWDLKCEVYLKYRRRDTNKKLTRRAINGWRTAVINEKLAQEKLKIKLEMMVKQCLNAWNEYATYKQRRKLHNFEAIEYYQTIQKKKLLHILQYYKSIRSAKHSARLLLAFKTKADSHYNLTLLKKSFRALLNWCYTLPLPSNLKGNRITPTLEMEPNLSPIHPRPLSSSSSTPVNRDVSLEKSLSEMVSTIQSSLMKKHQNMPIPYKKE